MTETAQLAFPVKSLFRTPVFPLLEYKPSERAQGQLLRDVQIQFFSLWSPDRKSHTEALGTIYEKLKQAAGAAEEKGLSERLNDVLKRIEGFMIDLKSVHLLEKLNDERGWDGLYKIAMHEEGEERIPAVHALGRLGHTRHLETIGTFHTDPMVASAAVVEIVKLAKFTTYTTLGDPYSGEAYILARMVTEANTHYARCVALLGLANLSMRRDSLGEAANFELRWLTTEAIKIEPAGMEVAKNIVEAPRVLESPDDKYQTNAWETWRYKTNNLQSLTDETEFLAARL